MGRQQVRRGRGGIDAEVGHGADDAGVTDAAPLPEHRAFTTEVIADGGNTLLLLRPSGTMMLLR